MKLTTIATMCTLSALVVGGCQDTTASTDEAVGQASQPIQAAMNGVCSTTNEISAEFMRAAMKELGRYRPGLDFFKRAGGNGNTADLILAPTTASAPDLDGDGQPDGEQLCAARGGCPEIKALLTYQLFQPADLQSLSDYYPWMLDLQPALFMNNITSNVPQWGAAPQYNYVMPHNLTFDHISSVSAQHGAGCDPDLRYHCFKVSGLPAGQTINTLATALTGIMYQTQMQQLTSIFVENNSSGVPTLCIDPDGGGGDSSTPGTSGAATCSDGTVALMYDPTLLGGCCSQTINSVLTNGEWIRHPLMTNYVVCKVTDLAANQVATADSSAPSNPPTVVTAPTTNAAWAAPDNNAGHFVTVDLGSTQTVTGMLLTMPPDGVPCTYHFLTSTDNASWTSHAAQVQNTPDLPNQDTSWKTSVRYVRVVFDAPPPAKPAKLKAFKIFK